MDLVDHEAVGDAAPLDAGDAAVVEAPVEEPAAAEAAPEPGPLDSIDLDSLRALAEVAPHLIASLNQPPTPTQQQQQGAQTAPELDPLDPESMQQYFAWRDEQLLGQIRGMVDPISQHAEQQAANEQQALLKDAAHDTEMRLGEFIDGDKSRQEMLAAAKDIFGEVSQRYGMTDRAAEIALERAHAVVAEREKRIGEAYHQRAVNELKTLTGARIEPGKGAAGTEAPGEYATEADAAAAFIARREAAA